MDSTDESPSNRIFFQMSMLPATASEVFKEKRSVVDDMDIYPWS